MSMETVTAALNTLPMGKIFILELAAVSSVGFMLGFKLTSERKQARKRREAYAAFEQKVADIQAAIDGTTPRIVVPRELLVKVSKYGATPPRAARVLLDLAVKRKDYDQLLGDMEEAYTERKAEHSLLYAKFFYWLDTVRTVVRLWAPRVVKWIFIIEEIRSRSRPH